MGKMVSVLPGQAQGLILLPCLPAACPSKLSLVLSAERTSQRLIKESLFFLLRKVALTFLKGYYLNSPLVTTLFSSALWFSLCLRCRQCFGGVTDSLVKFEAGGIKIMWE